MKRVPFVNREYTKGALFLGRVVYKRVLKGLDLGVEPSCIKNLLSTPTPPHPPPPIQWSIGLRSTVYTADPHSQLESHSGYSKFFFQLKLNRLFLNEHLLSRNFNGGRIQCTLYITSESGTAV